MQKDGQAKNRVFTPYELTQLAKYGKARDLASLKKYGQTPVEYITGSVEFSNLELKIDARALIPRVETEQLVELVLDEIKNRSQPLHIVEVGTGSGAISLALAKEIKAQQQMDIHLTATDLSEDALNLAKENWQQLTVAGKALAKITWLQGNLIEPVAQNQTIDLLVANLPYIPTARIAKLDTSVKEYEPLLALDGGADGLDLIRKLLHQALPLANQNTSIWLEIDDTHTQEKWAEFARNFSVELHQDSFGKNRFAELHLRSS